MRPLLTSASLFVCCLVLGKVACSQLPEDRGPEANPLSPEDAEKQFRVTSNLQWDLVLSEPLIRQPLSLTFDDEERLWLVEYRQYPEPAGLKPQSRDIHWRIVYDKVPGPPGQGGVPGIDRVSVHEDRDKDGNYETHSVFLDNLNIATSVVPQKDGVWVLNPPYLLFYPDRNRDLQPDGLPEIHLEGFGLEDTHSVVNSLCMGPDGWLYAAQGSTVTGAVRPYGSKDAPIKTLGQAIWRYHPQTKRYEVFAEGGGNAFGVAFDDHGDIFSGHNGGDTRGFHYLQGGYYRKGFSKHGSLSNPYAFGYLMPMKHVAIQRFTHTMFVFDQYWQKEGSPSLLALDPLHGKLIHSTLETQGSTYSTTDVSNAVACEDKWFRPVAVQQGPDGAIYVCDWYDYQVAHIYAHVGQLDKERGRVYRLAPHAGKENVSIESRDLTSIEQAISALSSPIRWKRQQARNWIANHPKRTEYLPTLARQLTQATDPQAIELLWTIHACGGLPGTIPQALVSEKSALENSWLKFFTHPSHDVRKWMIRLSCDDHFVEPEVLAQLTHIAQNETNIHVLCQLASSLRRLDANSATSALATLAGRELPQDDPGLASLLWWAFERHCDESTLIVDRVISPGFLYKNQWIAEYVMPRMIERWCRDPLQEKLSAVERTLASIESSSVEFKPSLSILVVEAFERAYQNRSLKSVPRSVVNRLAALGVPSLTLEIRQERADSIQTARKQIQDSSTNSDQRIALIQLAGEMRLRDMLPVLIRLVESPEKDQRIVQASLSALASFEDDDIAKTILNKWSDFSETTRSVAGATLAKRKSWVGQWLQACEDKRIAAESLPLDAQRAMRWIDDESIQASLGKLYTSVAGFSLVDANKEAKRYEALIDAHEGDPYRGKALYKAHCGRCHKLFDEGGSIGPDLTGYQRDQVSTLLRNIIAPSLEIREGYETVSVVTEAGTVVTGFVENETDQEIVVKGTDGQPTTISLDEIQQRKKQALSIMPERILESLTSEQVSDLLSYLRSTQPLLDKN